MGSTSSTPKSTICEFGTDIISLGAYGELVKGGVVFKAPREVVLARVWLS
jgi:hypothetical protein